MVCISATLQAQTQNTWTQKANFGGMARQYAVGFSIGTKGYIGTGYNGSYLNDFWEYDQQSNTWTQKANFGGTARYLAVGFSIGSKGYIGTGSDGAHKNDFWEYDPSANTWIQKANFSGFARSNAVGFSIGSKGYIGTGGNESIAMNDFWEYDPASDTWTSKAFYPGNGRGGVVGFSIGTKGYAGTGAHNPAIYDNDFWEYNPVTNAWTQKANFGGTGRSNAVGFSIDDKGYIGTGWNNGFIGDFWEYNPVTNTWQQEAVFGGSSRLGASGFAIGIKGYIGTGLDGTLKNDLWEYKPWCYFPPATITAGGPTTFCSGGNVILSANTGTGLTYQWKLNLANIAGATASNYTAAQSGNYTAVVTNACGSNTSNIITVTVNPLPAQPGSITGAATVCPTQSGYFYSVIVTPNVTSYFWALPAGASGSSTTNLITVNFAAFTGGNICVSALNSCGSSTASCKAITALTIPSAPATITGTTTPCANSVNVLYSCSSESGAPTYTWAVPATATLVNGQGTTAITVNFSSTFASGTISVTATNCAGTGSAQTKNVYGIPATPGTISGPATFCANQQGVAYSIAAVAGASTYNWLVPNGATVASGQGTTSITVNFGTKNGNIKVRAGNACGNSAYKSKSVSKNCREASEFSETENEITVYPNPSSGDFVFEIANSNDEKISIQIYNVIGKMILSETKFNSLPIAIGTQLVSGIYSAVVTVGDLKKVFRIVKTE